MQTVLVHDFLPAYGRQGLTEDARVCFAGQRSAQIFDTDFEEHVGTVQRELAVRFRSAGDGASFLSLSRPSDVVLVHKGRSRGEDDELRGRLTRIAEHLDRCGIAVGSVELVESLREAIGDYSATRFVCPTVFSRDVAECFGDDGAIAMRLAILHLQNKANFTQLLSSKSPNSVRVHKTSDYTAAAERLSFPIILKAEHSSGGLCNRVIESATEALDIDELLTSWGKIIAQSAVQGVDHYTYYLIHPGRGVSLMSAGQLIQRPGDRFDSNLVTEFPLKHDPASDTAAGTVLQYAESRGAAAFTLGIDWRNDYRHLLDGNPRICACTPMVAYLRRAAFPITRIQNTVMIRPAGSGSTPELLDRLAPWEARPERQKGVVVYGAGEVPVPNLMVLFVNDHDGQIEAETRKIVGSTGARNRCFILCRFTGRRAKKTACYCR